jgi:hypothetical protein
MSTGISTYLANKWFDALGNATAFSVTTPYIQLHIGDPGANGTANTATETTRKSVSFGAASSGQIVSDADVTWTNISGSQDATHFSLWDASSSGNFLGSGTITANSYSAGDTYTIPSGQLTLSLTVAA